MISATLTEEDCALLGYQWAAPWSEPFNFYQLDEVPSVMMEELLSKPPTAKAPKSRTSTAESDSRIYPAYEDEAINRSYINRLRGDELLFLLNGLAASGEIAENVASAAQDIWLRISGSIPGVLRVPLLDSMSDGSVMLTWNTNPHHLDIEVLPDGTIEVFCRNRSTNESWDYEAGVDEKLPEHVLCAFNVHRIVS